MQVYATATAIAREISYPQLHMKGWLSILNSPPLGRVVIVASYWAVIVYLMTSTAIIDDAYYWERIGFRNAWISVTQVPLVYLLASKSSIIGYIIGSSHERLNWLHRWVSRTLLITVTVHGFFFWAEWVRADFVTFELAMMPVVKYGLGAWAVLVWTFFTSLAPLRRIAYEFFVLQHIISGAIFLWLLYVHVPSYAQYNIWVAIAALSFDRMLRFCVLLRRNFRFTNMECNGTQRVGHQVELRATCGDITVVTVKDVHFPWKPGQHLYLWIPFLGPLESHPFTIASAYKTPYQCHCNEIQFAIRTQSGFSKRIHQYAMKTQGKSGHSLTGFITGPYGTPLVWEAYESLVLISASTGASFTLPIVESVLSCGTTICTQRICFLLVVKKRPQIDFYAQRLYACISRAENLGIELNVQIALTGETNSLQRSGHELADHNWSSEVEHEKLEESDIKLSDDSTVTSSAKLTAQNETLLMSNNGCDNGEGESSQTHTRQIVFTYSRPDIKAFIRHPVEATGGETSVAICGGKSLVATVRNAVASLSDERAVHKGTGAQGIHLHVEEYCF
jgi:hypothetical protein